MKVLVTGAGGQLGAVIADRFAALHDVTAFARPQLDISDWTAVYRAIDARRPDVIINCAAYNDVDGAEDNAQTAVSTNGLAVLTLARGAARVGATLVHYSTDFVFDGTGSRPYVEEDHPNPQGVYACSKLLGEWFAAEAPRWFVLRVESLFGGQGRHGSFDRIMSALVAGEPIRVFADRTVSPSFADDVARATEALATGDAPSGLYHCVNSGQATWEALAREAARLLGVQPRLEPISLASVSLRAKRPQFCALSNAKLAALGIAMPSWMDALRRHLARARV